MGDADHRFLLKRHRIQIFIRDSPVNSPHPLPFTRIVNEIQHVVLNRQLASRHQMRSCLLSKIGMLKISGVIPSRRENHRMAACVAIIHGAPEQCGIISIVFNMILLERIGTASAAQFSRYHRIRSAWGNPEVILQHKPCPVPALHQINACDMGENVFWRPNTVAGRKKAGGAVDKFLGNHMISDNPLFPVYILYKSIQGRHPLLQPPFQVRKSLFFNDPGNRVKWEKLLFEFIVLIYPKFHAISGQQPVYGLRLLHQF